MSLLVSIYYNSVVMLGVFDILLTMLSKIPDGSGTKYHMFDTIPSFILIFLRIILLFIIFYGIYCQVYPLKKL